MKEYANLNYFLLAIAEIAVILDTAKNYSFLIGLS